LLQHVAFDFELPETFATKSATKMQTTRNLPREGAMLEMENLLPLLEAIVSYIDDGVVIADDQCNVFYMNPAAHGLLSVPANHAVSKLDDLRSTSLQYIFRKSQQQAIKSSTFTKIEQRIHTDDGGHRDLEFECCFPGEVSSHLRLLIIRDVTQRRAFEAYLGRAAGDLITNDPHMLDVLQRIEQVAPQSAAVLLQGESGTGKTHLARLVHRLSKRGSKPLVEVNCAAIPDTLLESELFGHVKGAFTGATHNRKGRFQMAHGGTLFLDEIGEIPLHLQPKLLRAIQDRQIEPLGSDKSIKVDVRIVAASNRNLREMVDAGEFRADLYYRLAVIPIYIPPVRARPGDIPLLLKHFCYNLESRGYPSDVTCSDDAMRRLMDYPWPGNVRELENAVEHAIICSVNKVVEVESLPMDIRTYKPGQDRSRGDDRIARPTATANPPQEHAQGPSTEAARGLHRDEILDALTRAKGNRNMAAQLLGVDRTTLWRRMRRLHITPPRNA
jgi:transcriptional regulator with GAF, ATPase, and Fis domain